MDTDDRSGVIRDDEEEDRRWSSSFSAGGWAPAVGALPETDTVQATASTPSFGAWAADRGRSSSS